jgi:hypothetical protein
LDPTTHPPTHPLPRPALPRPQDRLNRLNAVVAEVATERAQRFQGRTLEVLVEGVNKKVRRAAPRCLLLTVPGGRAPPLGMGRGCGSRRSTGCHAWLPTVASARC